MQNELEKHEYKHRILRIYLDELSMNYETLVGDYAPKIATWHRRYCIDVDGREEFGDKSDFKEWAKENRVFYKHVFMMDHGLQYISTSPYSCPWDSGHVGFVYVTRDILNGWCGDNWKRISKKRKASILDQLTSHVKYVSAWMEGQVFGYELEESIEEYEKVIDSCWGIVGCDFKDSLVKQFLENGEVAL